MKATASLALILFATAADAQVVCRQNVCRNRVIAPQVVSAPVVKSTVSVPTISVPQVTVPAYGSSAFAYQVGADLRAEALAELIAIRVAELLTQQAPAAPASGRASDGPAPGTDFTAAAQSIVSRSCVNCHRHNGSGEGMDLRNLSTVPAGQEWAIFKKTYLGEMPKDKEPLPLPEVEAILRWAANRK